MLGEGERAFHFELAVSHSTTLSKLMFRVQLILIIVHLFSVM